MMTTETENGETASALAAGVDACVTKPFDAATLRGQLKALGLPVA